MGTIPITRSNSPEVNLIKSLKILAIVIGGLLALFIVLAITLTLLFDPGHNLEERIIREQFMP